MAFNWIHYKMLNPDLAKNGVHTMQQFILHYNNYGKSEGRTCNILDVYPNFNWTEYKDTCSLLKTKEDCECHFLTLQINKTTNNIILNNIKIKPYLVVGLSTTPSRIKYIKPTLDSIINQHYRPNRIILSIPNILNRTGEVFPELPDEINSLVINNIIEINRTNDYGPATKFVGILEKESTPDSFILWCDDDIIYNSHWSLYLVNELINNPKTALGVAGCNLKYINNKYICRAITINLHKCQILEGFNGVICRLSDMPDLSNFPKISLKEYNNFTNVQKAKYLSDDVIISYLLRKNNISTLVCNNNKLNRSNSIIVRDIGLNSDALHKQIEGNICNYILVINNI